MRARLILATLIVLTAAAAGRSYGNDRGWPTPVRPKIYRGAGWAIAAPESWQRDTGFRPPTVLALRGENTEGFPPYDGTLTPLEIGLHVQQFDPSVGRVELVIDAWKKRLQEDRVDPVVGEFQQRPLQLSGDTAAQELAWQTAIERERRIGYHFAVFAATSDGSVVAAWGRLRFGRAARDYVNRTGMVALLRAHLASLTVDDAPVDVAALAAAYRGYAWQVVPALRLTIDGREAIRRRDWPQASSLLRRAVETCDLVAAAHERLAWVHVSTQDPQLRNPEFAARHAEIAAELTAWLDLPALDTLALAHIAAGRPQEAAAVYRKALEKDPGNEMLRERLRLYQR